MSALATKGDTKGSDSMEKNGSACQPHCWDGEGLTIWVAETMLALRASIQKSSIRSWREESGEGPQRQRILLVANRAIPSPTSWIPRFSSPISRQQRWKRKGKQNMCTMPHLDTARFCCCCCPYPSGIEASSTNGRTPFILAVRRRDRKSIRLAPETTATFICSRQVPELPEESSGE